MDSTSTLAPEVSGSVGDGAGQFFTPIGSSPVYNNYNSYQVSTVLEPNYVAFANNATIAGGAGLGSSITSSTSIAVTFTNTTGQSITPTLESTILPGGFGFYAGDLTGNPTLSNGVVGDINLTPQSKTVNLLQLLAGYYPQPVWNEGTVSFSFQILQGANVLASYTGSAYLNLLGNYCTSTCTPPYAVQTGAYTLSTPLNNFGLIASNDPNGAVGFRWDATPVAVDLGTIAAGDSTTLSYVTSVTASIRNPGFFNDQAPIAYVGFGDPIGSRGGAGGIHDPNFPLLQYDVLPTYDQTTDQLTSGQFMGYTKGGFPVTDTTLPASSNPPPITPPATLPIDPSSLQPAVPEPGAWVLMLAGLSLTGGALRSRRSHRLA